ncbi:Uncharacterised protein [Mycobacteroides abscessus subsp. abscessus]|nr:Uncharacterised protein [Mycobacteroides abscessus subsp. abscessus]
MRDRRGIQRGPPVLRRGDLGDVRLALSRLVHPGLRDQTVQRRHGGSVGHLERVVTHQRHQFAPAIADRWKLARRHDQHRLGLAPGDDVTRHARHGQMGPAAKLTGHLKFQVVQPEIVHEVLGQEDRTLVRHRPGAHETVDLVWDHPCVGESRDRGAHMQFSGGVRNVSSWSDFGGTDDGRLVVWHPDSFRPRVQRRSRRERRLA